MIRVYSIGTLTADLAAHAPGTLITCEGRAIVDIGSDRGWYDHAALILGEEGTTSTVKDVLELLRSANGGVFYGYKGGEYTYSDGTPVHVTYAWGSLGGAAGTIRESAPGHLILEWVEGALW